MDRLYQQTLVIIKPDAVRRGLVGEIIGRYEKKGLTIRKIKSIKPSMDILHEHYSEHIHQPFFQKLLEFMSSGEVVVVVLEGVDAVDVVRSINGATHYKDALPGSIRGTYALDVTENLVHGSDSSESARRELGIWFGNEAML
jgi:nucleoside-diphosphate kinase